MPQFLKSEYCVYCHASGKMEKEDVVAKQFYPKPRPSNLRTVPGCTNCNRRFGLIEEYLRIIFTLDQSCKSKICLKIREQKSPYKKLSVSKKLLEHLRSRQRRFFTRKSSGLLTEDTQLPLDASRLDPFVKKIVFGLHYIRTSERLKLDSRFVYKFQRLKKGIDFSEASNVCLGSPRWLGTFDWAVADNTVNQMCILSFALWDTYLFTAHYDY